MLRQRAVGATYLGAVAGLVGDFQLTIVDVAEAGDTVEIHRLRSLPMTTDRLDERDRRGLPIDDSLNLRLPGGERGGLCHDDVRIADLAGDVLVVCYLLGAIRRDRRRIPLGGNNLQHAQGGELILRLLKRQQHRLPVFGNGLLIRGSRLIDSRRARPEVE